MISITEKAEPPHVTIVDSLPYFDKLVYDAFLQMRESIVDLSKGTVATLLYFERTIHVSTYQRLSRQNLAAISQKLRSLAAAFLKAPFNSHELRITVNNEPYDVYKFGEHCRDFEHEVLFPVALEKDPLGVIFIEMIDTEHSLQLGELIRAFKTDFTNGMSSLWRLYRGQQEQFQALATRTIDGIIFCGPDAEIKFINRTALQLLGAGNKRIVSGQHLSDLKADYLDAFLAEAIESGLTEVNRVAELKRKGTVLLGVHLEFVKDFRCGSPGWLIVLRDITANWQNDRLRSTLAIAGHEVRTPLGSVNSVVELLRNEEIGKLNKKQHRCLQIVGDDISRLQRLLDELLDPKAAIAAVRFEERRRLTSLHMLADKVCMLLMMTARNKQIRIRNMISKSTPLVRGDRDRLQQVFFNLMENSIKFSMPETVVEIFAETMKGHIQVSIKDQGVGIPATELQRIFEPNVQLHNSPEHNSGQGLGLNIAKKIVEQAGGKIWVESAVGVGSSFHLTLPVQT